MQIIGCGPKCIVKERWCLATQGPGTLSIRHRILRTVFGGQGYPCYNTGCPDDSNQQEGGTEDAISPCELASVTCCCNKHSFYVPCCLYGIQLQFDGRSTDQTNLARESSVSLKFYDQDGGAGVASANHAGVHFWPESTTGWGTYNYGGLTWYRWGLPSIAPEDIFRAAPGGVNWEARIQFRNDYNDISLAQLEINNITLKLQFFGNTDISEVATLLPISVSVDPGPDWTDAANLIAGAGSSTCALIPACGASDTLVVNFGPVDPLTVRHIIVDSDTISTDYIQTTIEHIAGNPEIHCFKNFGPTKRDVTGHSVTAASDCGPISGFCRCNCDDAVEGILPTSRCTCDECAGVGNPAYLGADGEDGINLRYPVIQEQTAVREHSTTKDWSFYFWFKPHDVDDFNDFTIFWQGNRCSDVSTFLAGGFDKATHIEVFYLANILTVDVFDTSGTFIPNTVTIDLTGLPFSDGNPLVVDQYYFIGVSYYHTNREVTFRIDDIEKTDQVIDLGKKPNTTEGNWTFAGHTGRPELILNSGTDSQSAEGCFDGYTSLDVQSALGSIYASGCTA